MEKNTNDPQGTGSSTQSLRRVLGLTTAIMMVIGIMIGSGVFKKIAPMSALGMQPGYILAAWVVAGLITLAGAMSASGLSELSSESGGQYEYLHKLYGQFTGFLFGWSCFTVVGSAAIAAIAFIFAQAVHAVLPLPDPLSAWKDVSIGGVFFPFADSGIKIFSVATIMAITWVNYRGAKKGAMLYNAITVAKISGILIIIILGLFFASGQGNTPEVIAGARPVTNTGHPSFSIFFAALLSAFWAYDGWLCVAFISGEIKRPERNIPIALVSGVSVVIIIYLLINYAFLHAIPMATLSSLSDKDIAASVMVKSILGNTGVTFISIMILLSTFGALNGNIITYGRLYYKMAKDGLFFSSASSVHRSFCTPHISLLYSMLMSCLLVFSGSFDQLTDMVIFWGFLFYAMIAWGIIKLKLNGRITKKVPGYPVAPIVFILFSTALLVNTAITQPRQTIMGSLLMLAGVPLYFYFRKKSRSLVE